MRALHLAHTKLLQGVLLGACGKGTSLSVAKKPFIEEKIPLTGHNDYSGFGLVYNNPRKKKCGRLPSPSDVGLTKVFDRERLNGRIRLILVGLYL